MRNRNLYYIVFIIFGVSAFTNAQRLHELTPYPFYQEWSLDAEESNGDTITYKPKVSLKPIASNHAYPFLKFSRRHYLLYFLSPKLPKASKPAKPIKWSNAPKGVPKYRPRCGNEFIGKRNKIKRSKGVKLNWKKGTWRVFIKDQTRFLVIEHKVSKNGKDYMADKKEKFQIVSLEEDRMVLRKVNMDGEHL